MRLILIIRRHFAQIRVDDAVGELKELEERRQRTSMHAYPKEWVKDAELAQIDRRITKLNAKLDNARLKHRAFTEKLDSMQYARVAKRTIP